MTISSYGRVQKALRTNKPTVVPWLEFILSIVLKQAAMAVELLGGERILRNCFLKNRLLSGITLRQLLISP